MSSYVYPTPERIDPPHSNRDLSLYKAVTASVGPLMPVLSVDLLPDDWMRINTRADISTLPMVAPVRGRWKLSFDYYYNPWSNIYGFMDNNTRLDSSQYVNMNRITFDLGREITLDVNEQGEIDVKDISVLPRVGAGSLLDYLGAPVGYMGAWTFNHEDEGYPWVGLYLTSHPAESFVTYIDIVRNYYVNGQFNDVPYISRSFYPLNDIQQAQFISLGAYEYDTLQINHLDDFVNSVRYYTNASSSTGNVLLSSSIQKAYYNGLDAMSPAVRLLLASQSVQNDANFGDPYIRARANNTGRQCGLFLRTYRMDLLRGIMNNNVGNYQSTVRVTNGQVEMTTIYFANKLQQFINYLDFGNHRFTDIIRSGWNVDPGIDIDRPLYLGSHSIWLNTIDVIATGAGQSGETGVNNPNSILGQQAGFGVGRLGYGEQRPITLKTKQYGTLMCIMSIVPDVVYSQGFELPMLKTKFADIYQPTFAQLGYQDVSRFELNAFPSIPAVAYRFTDDNGDVSAKINIVDVINGNGASVDGYVEIGPDISVGKRIAWSEYMAGLNRSHGDFAYGGSLDYWVNNRNFTKDSAFVQSWMSRVDVPSSGQIDDNSQITGDFSWVKRCQEFDMNTYVYPDDWNTPFADKSLTAMNFMVDVFFDIDANRALGKRIMPHM